MAAAKYLVTVPPGAYVGPPVGFVRIADAFTAPSESYVPSKTFRPLNEEARLALEKVFATEKAHLEKHLAKAKKDEAKEALEQRLEELEGQRAKGLELLVLPHQEPIKEPGVTLDELAKLNESPRSPQEKPDKPAPAKGTRAADR
jgi:hypothetical protein